MAICPIAIELPRITQIELMRRALNGHPNEVCGYITKRGEIVDVPNTFDGDRKHGFDMEIDLDAPISKIWHSHPTGPIHPSIDDIPAMEALSTHGSKFPWVIVAPGGVTEWIYV